MKHVNKCWCGSEPIAGRGKSQQDCAAEQLNGVCRLVPRFRPFFLFYLCVRVCVCVWVRVCSFVPRCFLDSF